MPKRTSYVQGTPNWVDLQTTDQDGAKSFYGQLFGWEFNDEEMPDSPAVYSLAMKGTDTVAAIAPQAPGMAEQGIPPMWNTYIAVDDVDACAARVADAGGQLAMGPFDVMDAGRMAFVLDPSNAAVGLWQAKQHIGATLVNEPGALIWNELITDGQDRAAEFYRKVFGMTTDKTQMPDMEYTMFKAGDEPVGGMMAPPMDGIPNHWHVYFAVESADDASAKATSLGATVVNGPMDIPIGRMCVLSDPQGAVFSVFAPKTEG